MTLFVSVLCVFLIGSGIIFSIVPPLPGPMLSFGAMLVAHFFIEEIQYSTTALWVWGILVGLILIADMLLPIMATRKFGGTRAGIYGGLIGLVAGIVLPIPFGIILGPLLGAIIGDLFGGNQLKAAFRSGFGSFVGFLVGTFFKLSISIIMGIILILDMGHLGINYFRELLS